MDIPVITIIIVAIIIIPPIVGVPCFFKWDCGPSSLSICPTFNLLSCGIVITPAITDTAKDIKSIIILKFNFLKPFYFFFP